jgi:hypothetical protein
MKRSFSFDNAMLTSVMLLTLAGLEAELCHVATASTIVGNTFSGATTPGFPTDGAIVLDIQTNHPMPFAGTIDSYTFLGTTGGLGAPYGNGPYSYDFLILHPTGNPNEYNVLYDSGPKQPTTIGIQTVAIPPVAVQAGDVIADWGRGISFDIPGGQSVPFYFDGSNFGTPDPSGTFTVNSGTYPLGNDRTYYLQASLSLVPEPSAVLLLACGSVWLGWCGARRRRCSQNRA